MPRTRCLFVPLLLSLLSSLLPSVTCRITAEDVNAKRNWPTWSTMEKLDFLLYPEDWYKLREEFGRLDAGPADGSLTMSEFGALFGEDRSAQELEAFHAMCEKEGRDEGKASTCNFEGYVVARGFYDASGNAFEAPEWEMREGIFLASYHEDSNRPDITPEELELLGIKVGPDGIIID